MTADIGRKPDAYRSIRFLFIIGLVGLILAACGVTWLLVEYAQVPALLAQREAQKEALLAPRAAMYRGSWVEKQDPSFAISRIEINSNGLNMTMHVAGNCREFTYVPCDMGTFTQTFTGEPFTTVIVFADTNGTRNSWPLVMNLSNTDDTKLQVVANNANGLFDKA